MKATITIEFIIDGEQPPRETLVRAIDSLLVGSGYVGSEQIDGTDDWGIEIESWEVEIEEESE